MDIATPFSGQAGIVTGATRGIGRAIALELARRGADVAFNYAKSAEAADTLKAEIEALNVRVDRAIFSGGAINFSDRFIKPNYDANLTDVAGSLTGLSPAPDSLAELSLKALVDRARGY